MVTIHLYGKLRRLVPGSQPNEETVLRVEPGPGETVMGLLARSGIPMEELHHVFVNGALLATQNTMAPWLRYPQARQDVWDWESDLVAGAGDRIGLFADDMASLVV